MKYIAVQFFICLAAASSCGAQGTNRQILTGIVLGGQAHEPLAGATIRIIGTTLGTATNADGHYRLLLAPGKYDMLVSYIGCVSDTVRADIDSHDVYMDVCLAQSEISLPEVFIYPGSANPAD